MDLADVLHTTHAARDFTDEPVTDEDVARVLDLARFAPSGGNRQGWRVIVVRDRSTRERFAELVESPARQYAAQVAAGENPWNTIHPSAVGDATVAATPVPPNLRRPLLEAPVLLVVTIDLSVCATFDRHLDRVGVIAGASIYPFVWNILLAARSEGLGGTVTTLLAAEEPAVRSLLGFPEHVALAAVIPLGHPTTTVRRLRRRPVDQIAVRERWDGDPLPPPS